MNKTNEEIVHIINNACNLLIRAETYCDVVNEIFIYNKYQPFDEDYLKEFFSDDIRRFINKQYKYLSNLLKEVNKDEYKN